MTGDGRPAAMLEALESRSLQNLTVVAEDLDSLRADVVAKERERDRLLRESAPVLRREKAAVAARLSLSRVEQIIGGAT